MIAHTSSTIHPIIFHIHSIFLDVFNFVKNPRQMGLALPAPILRISPMLSPIRSRTSLLITFLFGCTILSVGFCVPFHIFCLFERIPESVGHIIANIRQKRNDNNLDNTLFFHGLRHNNTPFPYALRLAIGETSSSLTYFDGDEIQAPYRSSVENQPSISCNPSNILSNGEPTALHMVNNRNFPDQPIYHLHDHYQISMCTEGGCDYIVNNQRMHVGCGDILCINLNAPHTWYSPKSSTFLHLGFYPNSLNYNSFCARFNPYVNLLYSQFRPFLLIPAGTPANAQLLKAMKEIENIHEMKMPCYDALIHNRIVDLTIHLVLFFIVVDSRDIEERSPSANICKAIAFINNNFCEPITVNTVATHIGMNGDYFSHYFKKKMGLSCKKYINFKRIEHAASLLGDADTDIAQVAFESGFSSLSTFYKCFTESYHMSPSQFRQSVCRGFS